MQIVPKNIKNRGRYIKFKKPPQIEASEIWNRKANGGLLPHGLNRKECVSLKTVLFFVLILRKMLTMLGP